MIHYHLVKEGKEPGKFDILSVRVTVHPIEGRYNKYHKYTKQYTTIRESVNLNYVNDFLKTHKEQYNQ